jgi:hypothetical protein
MNWTKYLNQALQLFSLVEPTTSASGPRRIFGMGEGIALYLVGNSVAELDLLLDTVLSKDSELGNTCSRKVLLENIVSAIRAKKTSGGEFTQLEAQEIRSNVLEKPDTEYRVVRDLYGATLGDNVAPVQFGPLKVYDRLLHETQVFGDYAKSKIYQLGNKKAGLLIECCVSARDDEKAKELADVLFFRFELILRAMIGRRTDNFAVGILNYSGPLLTNYYVFSEKQNVTGSAWNGSLSQLPLHEPFFQNPSDGLKRLLSLIGQQNNNFERRLLRCAEWLGQAIGDPNPSSAFIKAATALEVLFVVSEGVVTPSIMAQISESCAFILGSTAEERLKVEKDVKRLYGIRSAVVHSGKESVDLKELDRFIAVGHSVMHTLLSGSAYAPIESIEALHEYLKQQKYA